MLGEITLRESGSSIAEDGSLSEVSDQVEEEAPSTQDRKVDDSVNNDDDNDDADDDDDKDDEDDGSERKWAWTNRLEILSDASGASSPSASVNKLKSQSPTLKLEMATSVRDLELPTPPSPELTDAAVQTSSFDAVPQTVEVEKITDSQIERKTPHANRRQQHVVSVNAYPKPSTIERRSVRRANVRGGGVSNIINFSAPMLREMAPVGRGNPSPLATPRLREAVAASESQRQPQDSQSLQKEIGREQWPPQPHHQSSPSMSPQKAPPSSPPNDQPPESSKVDIESAARSGPRVLVRNCVLVCQGPQPGSLFVRQAPTLNESRNAGKTEQPITVERQAESKPGLTGARISSVDESTQVRPNAKGIGLRSAATKDAKSRHDDAGTCAHDLGLLTGLAVGDAFQRLSWSFARGVSWAENSWAAYSSEKERKRKQRGVCAHRKCVHRTLHHHDHLAHSHLCSNHREMLDHAHKRLASSNFDTDTDTEGSSAPSQSWGERNSREDRTRLEPRWEAVVSHLRHPGCDFDPEDGLDGVRDSVHEVQLS